MSPCPRPRIMICGSGSPGATRWAFCPEPLIIKRGGHPDQLSRQWGLDRFRIQALRKILQEPLLPPDYREAAERTLRQKCAIYAQGCEKRGKLAEAREYKAISCKL
jgi:hypothetical protein